MKISNKIKSLITTGAIAIASLGVMAPTYAVTCPTGSIRAGQSVDTYAECNVEKDEQGKDLMSTLKTIINVVLAVVGFISVAVLIVGGISYSTSAGDAGKVKKAMDTIKYGIIGLVISLLAFAIVNFVLTSIFK